jgi:hypothetical protein
MPRTKSRLSNLQSDINDYFLQCDTINQGQKNIIKPYTLSGLLCHLNITRNQFEDMCKMRKYAKTLIGAKAKIEAFIEENSLTGSLSANASSNSLKYNFGWGEKQDANDAGMQNIVISMQEDQKNLAQ